MKTFRQFTYESPGAGYWGTHELRKRYVADTPGQVDPLAGNTTPTPQVFQSKSSKQGTIKPKRQDPKK